MKKSIIIAALASTIIGSNLYGISANINYGSAAALGGALFQGSDDLAADSISIGYFDGSANALLTGWNALGSDSVFENSEGFNTASVSSADTTLASGKDAWILISDSGLFGLIRSNSWTAYTGATAPTPIPLLAYELDATASSLNVTTLGNISVADNAGVGGSSGIMVSVVPEPSSFALLAGVFGLAWVMVRRRA